MAKTIKFAGPSKKMMEALENEGLNIQWPKAGNLKEENLAIEGTFYTGADWEKLVVIDLRDKCGLSSKSGVDYAIAKELVDAYEAFDIDEEMQLYLQGTTDERQARGVPDAARLLEDMKEQEERLNRFSDVADAVAGGRPVPPEHDNRKIEIDGNTAEQIVALLEYAKDHLDPHATVDCLNVPNCMDIINELKRKLEG